MNVGVGDYSVHVFQTENCEKYMYVENCKSKIFTRNYLSKFAIILFAWHYRLPAKLFSN